MQFGSISPHVSALLSRAHLRLASGRWDDGDDNEDVEGLDASSFCDRWSPVVAPREHLEVSAGRDEKNSDLSAMLWRFTAVGYSMSDG